MQSPELQLSFSGAPDLAVALKQLRCVFDVLKCLALLSQFEIDATHAADRHCLRSLIANSFRNLFRGFVRFKCRLVVARLAVDIADRGQCLTLNSEIF